MAAAAPAGLALAGPTAVVLAAAGDVRELLTRTELDRAGALRSAGDRDDFLAAQSLTVVQSCGSCDRPHGRPRLVQEPATGISFAHTRGWVAAAAAPGPVGVDVETLDGHPLDRRVAEAVCSEEELAAVRADEDPQRAFLRQWVRKESLVKVGAATLDAAAGLDIPVYGQQPPRWRGWRLLDWGGERAVGCVAARVEMRLRLLG